MTFDATNRMIVPEEDPAHAEFREGRLRAMGVGEQPHPELDAVAHRLRQITGARYAMVNFVMEGRQYFAGLSVTEGPQTMTGGQAPGREMDLDAGFCVHTVSRGSALPITDISSYARFAGDRVAAELGVRTYLGAPVKDPSTGVTLGTVCVIDTQPINWTMTDVDNVKAVADDVAALLSDRENGREHQQPST